MTFIRTCHERPPHADAEAIRKTMERWIASRRVRGGRNDISAHPGTHTSTPLDAMTTPLDALVAALRRAAEFDPRVEIASDAVRWYHLFRGEHRNGHHRTLDERRAAHAKAEQAT